MPLVLTVISYRRQPPAQPVSRRFDRTPVTLGRAADNDLPLPDPDQLVSKRHCVIEIRDGRCAITDTSTNGVFLNGAAEPIGPGRAAPLVHGDRLTLGDYELLVQLETAAPARVGTPDDPFGLRVGDGTPGQPAAPSAAPPAIPDFLAPLGTDDPFAGSDPFATPGAGRPLPAGMPAPDRPDWLADPAPPAADPAFERYTQPDHLAAERVNFQAPPVIGQTIPDDWNTLPAAPPAAAGALLPDDWNTIATPASPAPPPPPVAAPPLQPASAGDPAAALAAFCAGAGIAPGDLPLEDPGAVMTTLGEVFRALAVGLRDALATRAMIKTEYRVEQTVIRATNNNPFKFAVEAEPLLTALLGAPRPGYLPGPQAVAEGFKDIRAHELALFAGMQTAVAALLQQFDPEALKKRLESGSILGNLLPGARKAKYWEIYEQQYKQIAAEVSEDVRGSFGRAFARAYEEQAKKL